MAMIELVFNPGLPRRPFIAMWYLTEVTKRTYFPGSGGRPTDHHHHHHHNHGHATPGRPDFCRHNPTSRRCRPGHHHGSGNSAEKPGEIAPHILNTNPQHNNLPKGTLLCKMLVLEQIRLRLKPVDGYCKHGAS